MNTPAKILHTFFCLIIVLSVASAHAQITVVDDVNANISLSKPATRIISLSPGLTEIIFSAGGGEYLKGVVSYSDFPEAAKKIPIVGSYNSIDIEKVVALEPDLIVAWKSGNPPLQLSKLQKIGLPIFTSEMRNFDDVPATISRLGKLMGTQDNANKAVKAFNETLNALKLKYKQMLTPKRVFIQIWNEPLMSVSGKHLISKIVAQCSGTNIFNDHSQLTLTLNAERIIEENPDIILVTRQGDLGNSWLSRWKQWEFLTAVKNNQLFTVNPNYIVRHTPRILNGIEEICGYIYKD